MANLTEDHTLEQLIESISYDASPTGSAVIDGYMASSFDNVQITTQMGGGLFLFAIDIIDETSSASYTHGLHMSTEDAAVPGGPGLVYVQSSTNTSRATGPSGWARTLMNDFSHVWNGDGWNLFGLLTSDLMNEVIDYRYADAQGHDVDDDDLEASTLVAEQKYFWAVLHEVMRGERTFQTCFPLQTEIMSPSGADTSLYKPVVREMVRNNNFRKCLWEGAGRIIYNANVTSITDTISRVTFSEVFIDGSDDNPYSNDVSLVTFYYYLNSCEESTWPWLHFYP